MPQTEVIINDSFIDACTKLSQCLQGFVKYKPTQADQMLLKCLEKFYYESQATDPLDELLERGLDISDLAFLLGVLPSPVR